jgi:hypothetical protein
VECLEDRLAPAVLQVIGAGGNGFNTFNTFAQAYGASTSRGDVIQIEPTAGDVGTLVLNNPSKALTVVGDQNFAAGGQEVADNVGLFVDGASLIHLQINGTVTVGAGFRGAFLNQVNLGNFVETAGVGNGGNTLLRDVIRGSVVLQGANSVLAASSGDQILGCDFRPGSQLQIGEVAAAASGVLVSDTVFEPSPVSAILITDSRNVTVADSRIALTTSGDAVFIGNSTAALPVAGLLFLRDDIHSLGGTGVHVNVTAAGEQLGLALQGVAFQGNRTAVAVTGNADLGAGSLLDAGGANSLGGNEFRRGVTTGVLVSDAALTGGHLRVFAGANSLGAFVTPVLVAAGSPAVFQTANLSDAQAFVQSLYHNFLTHTATAAELNFWVSLAPALGQQGIANAIIHSTEGLTRVVDQLYDKLLGRDADPQGQAFFVAQLSAGATEELVAAQIVASPEFAARANALAGTLGTPANLNFVRALYRELLGRGESAAEDNFWLGVTAVQGRSVVAADFLLSPEFRGDAVASLYTGYTPLPQDTFFATVPNLLTRPAAPSAGELNFWVNSGLDLLRLAATIAGSPEYFAAR